MTDKDSMIGRPVVVPREEPKKVNLTTLTINAKNHCGYRHYKDIELQRRIKLLERQLAEVTAHRDRLLELVDLEG